MDLLVPKIQGHPVLLNVGVSPDRLFLGIQLRFLGSNFTYPLLGFIINLLVDDGVSQGFF